MHSMWGGIPWCSYCAGTKWSRCQFWDQGETKSIIVWARVWLWPWRVLLVPNYRVILVLYTPFTHFSGGDLCRVCPMQSGVTPLYYASRYAHSEVVDLLLSNGADVNKVQLYMDTCTVMYDCSVIVACSISSCHGDSICSSWKSRDINFVHSLGRVYNRHSMQQVEMVTLTQLGNLSVMVLGLTRDAMWDFVVKNNTDSFCLHGVVHRCCACSIARYLCGHYHSHSNHVDSWCWVATVCNNVFFYYHHRMSMVPLHWLWHVGWIILKLSAFWLRVELMSTFKTRYPFILLSSPQSFNYAIKFRLDINFIESW